MPKSVLKIELADAINRLVDVTQAAISERGGHIFTVYQHFVSAPGNLAAELFLNADGTLVSLEQFFTSPETPGVYAGGGASHDFKRFLVLTQEDTSGLGIGRLNLLDRDFNIVETRDLTDYFTPAQSLLTWSPFSHDDRYIAFSYNTSDAPPSTGNLIVANARTLNTVGVLQYNGFSNGPYFFNVPDESKCSHYYLLFPTVAQESIGVFVAPALINIYEFFPKTGNFALVARQTLPQTAISYDVIFVESLGKAVITVSTREAHGPNDVSPNINPREAFVEKDTAEVRVYTFDGNHLELIATENLTTATTEIKIHPSGEYIVYGLRPQTLAGQVAPPAVLLPAYHINYKKKRLECAGDKGHLIAPNAIGGDFSDNGNWLVVTGSGRHTVKAIQLFRVSEEKL